MSEVPPPEVFLQPDFDGSSLKVAQLRGILLQYDITLPTGSKKADLVKAFQEQVQSRGSDILSSKSKVRASNKGIVSANTGEQAVSPPPAAAGVKRGRGRPKKASVAPEAMKAEESDASDGAPVEVVKRPRGRPRKTPQPKSPKAGEVEVEIPTKSRRSVSKQPASPSSRRTRRNTSVISASPAPSIPSAPSSSRKPAHSTASVVSELPALLETPKDTKTPRSTSKRKSEAMKMDQVEEEEEEKVDLAVRSPKKPKTPRRSEDSGFSDYNPFQSGGEEAQERERRRRKSSIGLGVKTPKPSKPRMSEPAPRQTPGTLRRMAPSKENLRTPPSASRDTAHGDKVAIDERYDAAETYNQAVSDAIAEMNAGQQRQPRVKVTSHVTPRETLGQRFSEFPQTIAKPRTAIPLSLIFLLLVSLLTSWKSQSQSIGYCDSGASTNDIILSRQSAIDAANACIARRTAQALDDPSHKPTIECDVSSLPLVPFLPRPTSCTPCPQHGICEDGKLLTCEPEYLLSPSVLNLFSPAVDGLPGLGPRAFPPTCRPDTAKKRMIGSLAKQMERDLAKGRGYIVCAGLGEEDGRKGQGERFGMEENTLRSRYLSRKDPKFSREQFEEIFEAALADLVEHDDIIESIDKNGHSWYAAARTDMTLACRAKLEFYSLLERWRSQLLSSVAVVAALFYIRSTMKHRQAEKYRADELVEVVLKRLQDQESRHYTDPVTTPNSFIPPNQLRDLVLPPKGSSASRTRLWQRVQDLVEANANVSVREREVKGEIWKTWEWAGVGERHVSFE